MNECFDSTVALLLYLLDIVKIADLIHPAIEEDASKVGFVTSAFCYICFFMSFFAKDELSANDAVNNAKDICFLFCYCNHYIQNNIKFIQYYNS